MSRSLWSSYWFSDSSIMWRDFARPPVEQHYRRLWVYWFKIKCHEYPVCIIKCKIYYDYFLPLHAVLSRDSIATKAMLCENLILSSTNSQFDWSTYKCFKDAALIVVMLSILLYFTANIWFKRYRVDWSCGSTYKHHFKLRKYCSCRHLSIS